MCLVFFFFFSCVTDLLSVLWYLFVCISLTAAAPSVVDGERVVEFDGLCPALYSRLPLLVVISSRGAMYLQLSANEPEGSNGFF